MTITITTIPDPLDIAPLLGIRTVVCDTRQEFDCTLEALKELTSVDINMSKTSRSSKKIEYTVKLSAWYEQYPVVREEMYQFGMDLERCREAGG